MLQPWMKPGDLASGDRKCLEADWSGFSLVRVTSPEDPVFDMAFGALWAEFGASGEVEQADVLARRMAWDPREPQDGCALLYEMLLVEKDGELVGVRDHTAIVCEGTSSSVVHMSHNFVVPAWRRSGIAGWLRALPVETARRCLGARGARRDSPITLVGEMEHAEPGNESRMVRLIAYEKAGYKKIDPRRVPYRQPDFRPPDVIDETGGVRPLPFSLLVRRVGREFEETISGSEVRHLVECLYRMYAVGFRERDMTPLFEELALYPGVDERIPLLPPTTVVEPR
jgi:GNAT superfamily N-acetyltransferase